MANISNKNERNQLNLAIRQQPWYQDWFTQRGLNPNMVKLNDGQRKELQQLVVGHGFLDPSDGHIDPAGNVSDFHGWKGLPTAAKIAIAGGVTAATLGAAGAFAGGAGAASGAAGGGSAAVGGGGAAATGIGGLGVGSLTSIPGVTTGVGAGLGAAGTAGAGIGAGTLGTTAAGGSGLFGKLATAAKNPDVWTAGGRMLGAAGAASAQNRGAETAAMLDRDRLQLEADQTKLLAEKSGRDAQSDAMNKATWGNYVANYQPSVPAEVAPYAGTIRQVSDAERDAGRTLAAQAKTTMDRGLYTSVNPTVTPIGDLPTQPGMFEKLAGYAGTGLAAYGALAPQKQSLTYADLARLIGEGR